MGWLIVISIIVFLILSLMYLGSKASRVDWGGRSINWIDGLLRLICHYIHHLPDNEILLPEKGAAIVVANHVSGLDPFLLIAACHRPLRFLIAREQYERPILHWLFKASGCIPVDRSSRPELALRQALRALKSGEVLALFPHGRIHLDSDPPRRLKGGFAWLAINTQAPIYPVRINGVTGEGMEALAPFIPSKVVLTIGDPISCQREQTEQCLSKVRTIIEKE